jgi:RNA polymerase sigma-70 factor (ECF subfamily)
MTVQTLPATGLSEFCRGEYARLVGSLSVYCGDHHLAEDLAQETLARACTHWETVRELESPGGWAHRVAINLANSWFRSRTARRRIDERLHARRSDTIDEPDPDTASTVAVRRAIAALPEKQRRAVVLRYYADFSVKEVAELMGCPEGTVKRLTADAIRGLRSSGLAVTE